MKRYYLQAKFAAFRPFVSGSFRPTAGFITPTAAYGLLLNIAGIEMRHDDGQSVMTLIRKDSANDENRPGDGGIACPSLPAPAIA